MLLFVCPLLGGLSSLRVPFIVGGFIRKVILAPPVLYWCFMIVQRDQGRMELNDVQRQNLDLKTRVQMLEVQVHNDASEPASNLGLCEV